MPRLRVARTLYAAGEALNPDEARLRRACMHGFQTTRDAAESLAVGGRPAEAKASCTHKIPRRRAHLPAARRSINLMVHHAVGSTKAGIRG
jgi:hypothetical protein